MNYHPEKTLMGCLATFLFLIALMGAYLKYAEAVEAGTEGAPALLYMLVMFFVIFIVAGSVTALLVTILTPLATQGILHLLPHFSHCSSSEKKESLTQLAYSLSSDTPNENLEISAKSEKSTEKAIETATAVTTESTAEAATKETSEMYTEAITGAAVWNMAKENTEIKELSEVLARRNAQSMQQQTEEIHRKEKQVLEELFAYTRGTFQKVFTPTQIETLIRNIEELYRVSKDPFTCHKTFHFEAVEKGKSPFYLNYDLEHFGWNVSTRIRMLCKKMNQGETIPHFLKISFPYSFASKEESSIKTKLTNETSKLQLFKGTDEMVPYVFPGTERIPLPSDE